MLYVDRPQYIASNYHEGIYIADSSEVNIDFSNYIGVGISGEDMGNESQGIYIDGGYDQYYDLCTFHSQQPLRGNWIGGFQQRLMVLP